MIFIDIKKSLFETKNEYGKISYVQCTYLNLKNNIYKFKNYV